MSRTKHTIRRLCLTFATLAMLATTTGRRLREKKEGTVAPSGTPFATVTLRRDEVEAKDKMHFLRQLKMLQVQLRELYATAEEEAFLQEPGEYVEGLKQEVYVPFRTLSPPILLSLSLSLSL